MPSDLRESEIESRAAKLIGYVRRFVNRKAFSINCEDFWGVARTIAAESIASDRGEKWAFKRFSRWARREWGYWKRKSTLVGFDVPVIPQPPKQEIPAWYFCTCSPKQESAVRRRYEQDLTWKQIGEIHGSSYEAVVIHHRKAVAKIRSLLT